LPCTFTWAGLPAPDEVTLLAASELATESAQAGPEADAIVRAG
jgi:hypothetical protein